ncbi:MAG: matrixin family metalloprotease, partial [Candidatus Eiseniibacteriota bacterium]
MTHKSLRIAGAALLFGAIAAIPLHPAFAFIRISGQASPTAPVVQAHWLDSELPLNSVIDPTNNDVPAADALAAILAAAQTWQDVNTSYFTINAHPFAGAPEVPPALAFDGQNSVIFLTDDTGTVFAPGVIEFVRTVFESDTGHSLDADMVFNDRDFFASVSTPDLTPAPPGQFSVDLQSVATHEYGHYLGLDHTSITGATMIPFVSPDISMRTIELDDRAGVSTIYPESASRPGGLSPGGVDFASSTGTVSGTVVSGYNGSAIFGAHVEAFLLTAPTPDHQISAISGELTLRNGMGDFTIHGLPPGPYAIAIVPLDGVHTIASDANIGGVYSGLDINFEPEFWNGANEGGNGFVDLANDYAPVLVNPGADAGGVNF